MTDVPYNPHESGTDDLPEPSEWDLEEIGDYSEDEESGDEFELDLTDLPDAAPGSDEAAPSSALAPSRSISPEQRLEELLAPYSGDSIDKAHKLLKRGQIQEVKHEGQVRLYNVMGSKLYVCKITEGEDFLFAECSCPNGMHRGGDAICYHSIAARVANAGLTEEWTA